MQAKRTENRALDVRVYYQALTKKERGQFLLYLASRYDYKQRTMVHKLNHRDALLRRDEQENIQNVIETGAWRQ